MQFEVSQINSVLDLIKTQTTTTGIAVVYGYYLKDVIKEIAGKLTYPAAGAIGDLFGKIIEHGTFQSQYSRDSASKIAKAFIQIAKKHGTTKPEDLVDNISPEISVPLFNKLTYYEDNDLRELLTSLLAGSMLKSEQVHPTIISLIDRFSTGEAIILKRLAKINDDGPWPCITVKAALLPRSDKRCLPSSTDLQRLDLTDKNLTYTDFLEKSHGRTGFHDIGGQHLATMNTSELFKSSDEGLFCVANLRHLGIVEVTDGILTEKGLYIDLLAAIYEYVDQARKLTSNEPIFEVSKLSITPVGKKIINTFKSNANYDK